MSPLMAIGIFVAIAALVSAAGYAILTEHTLVTGVVSNPDNGITVEKKSWASDGAYYPDDNQLTLGVMYQFQVDLKSNGAYTDVLPLFTLYKTGGSHDFAPTDAIMSIYYAGEWNVVTWNDMGTWATATVPAMDVPLGTAVTLYVDVTYMATGSYTFAFSATGVDA